MCPRNRRHGSESVLSTTLPSTVPRTTVGTPPVAALARRSGGVRQSHPKPGDRAPRAGREPHPSLRESRRAAGPEFHRGPQPWRPRPPGTPYRIAVAAAAAAAWLGLHEAGAAGPGRGGRRLAGWEARPAGLQRRRRGARRVLGLVAAVVHLPALGSVDARGTTHVGGGVADTLAGSRETVSKRPARRLADAWAGGLAGGGERGSRARKCGRPFLSRCGRSGCSGGEGAVGRAAHRGRPSEHTLPEAGAAGRLPHIAVLASAAPRFRGISGEEI